MTEFPDIIRSPLSQTFTHDGVTVRVEIYKIGGTDGWTLELIDEEGVARQYRAGLLDM